MLGSVSSLHKRCNDPKLSEMSKRNNNHKEYYRKPLCLYGTHSIVDSQMVCVSARPKLHIMSEIEAVFDSGPKGTIRTKLDQVLGKEKRKSEVKADHITEPESNNEKTAS